MFSIFSSFINLPAGIRSWMSKYKIIYRFFQVEEVEISNSHLAYGKEISIWADTGAVGSPDKIENS